jgi:four helix bundle protein
MKIELIQKNPLLNLCVNFSLQIIEYCEKLEAVKKYVLARQLLRSGTSIGANSMEAQNAESKADFIHKLKIAAKEAEETQYWLLLCNLSKSYPECSGILVKLEEIQKVLSKILSSAKKKSTIDPA